MQAIDEGEGIAAVKEAFDLGINFFDTSPYYGDTKSEAVRRWAMRHGWRHQRRCSRQQPPELEGFRSCAVVHLWRVLVLLFASVLLLTSVPAHV